MQQLRRIPPTLTLHARSCPAPNTNIAFRIKLLGRGKWAYCTAAAESDLPFQLLFCASAWLILCPPQNKSQQGRTSEASSSPKNLHLEQEISPLCCSLQQLLRLPGYTGPVFLDSPVPHSSLLPGRPTPWRPLSNFDFGSPVFLSRNS